LWKTGFSLTSTVASEMVLELPGLARENQNWKIYRAHILDSAATEGVVSHLSGAAPKPVDSRELEAWNSSNAMAKYIILEVITDSLLARLMHHELAHTLFSHLAAIFGNLEPIALETPVEWSDHDEPLCEDSHSKLDGADSARTAITVKGKDVEQAGAAAENLIGPPQAPNGLSSVDRSQEMEQCRRERITHDTDRETGHSGLPSELKTTEIRDEKPSGTTPAGNPSIPNTNSTTIYSKDPEDPPNAPDGMSRGDIQEMAESGGQWQRTVRKVNRNDETASPAPNMADRTSRMTMGDSPIPLSRKRPKNAVKHQHQSTRNIPLPIGHANANAQHSSGHPKPKIHLPRWHRQPLKGESVGGAANSYTRSSSGQSTPQKLVHSRNEPDTLVTISIKSENLRSSEIPRVRLASVRWHTDDVNYPARSRAAASNGLASISHGQTDGSRGWTDTLNASYNAKTAVMSDGDSADTHLGARGPKRAVDSANGLGGQTEMSEGQTDVSRAQTDVSNGAEMGSISCKDDAMTYLGLRNASRAVDETDGIGSHADALTWHEDTHSVETDALKPANATEIVSTHPIESKTPNSPTGDAKRIVDETDGVGHYMDMQSVRTC